MARRLLLCHLCWKLRSFVSYIEVWLTKEVGIKMVLTMCKEDAKSRTENCITKSLDNI